MRLIDNIFSSIYMFFEAIDDGRPGNKGTSIIGAIFLLTMIFTLNVLSFFSTDTLKEFKWIYYLVVLIVCSVLTIGYYAKARYLKIVNQFLNDKRKGTYNFITTVYILLSLAIFGITR